MKLSLYCPACGYKQICPCYKCVDIRDKTQVDLKLKPWQWTADSGSKCANCGFDASADFWAGLEKIITLWAYKAITQPMQASTNEILRVLDILEKQIKEITNEKARKRQTIGDDTNE